MSMHHIQHKQNPIMSDKKEHEGYQFHLKILTVKMKMKFPCRMALELNKQPVTKEVPSTEQNRFFFNEAVTLRGDGDGFAFELLATLYTEKGTKYTSGSMKLLSAQLRRSKGERLVIPLNKCLDPEAFCELLVEGVTDLKDSQLKLSRSSSKVLISPEKPEIVSPVPKKINSERFLIAETRSEANFHPTLGLAYEDRPRDGGPKSQVFKTFTKSPNSKFSNIKYATSNGNILGGGMGIKSQYPIEQGVSQRTSFDEGEVYREGYLKLKQKFKRQTELLKQETRKRVGLQANENNLKLQIMKMRVKSEEQDKQIAEKNDKLKQLSSQLSELQKKDLDLAYVKEECSNLERKNKIQQETITSLVSDCEAIKKLMAEKSKLDECTITGLRHELELAKNKVDQLKYEYELQSRAKQNIILTKNNDIQLRNDTIERQKLLIKQFEEQAQAKLFDFQRSLNNERNAYQLKIDESKVKIASIESEKVGGQQKNALLQSQLERLHSSITALEFNKKILNEEAAQAGQELAELKTVKDRYIELTKEHRFLEQQFATVRKNLEATLQNKEVDLGELLKQYEQGKVRNEKLKGQQDDKIKLLSAKLQEAAVNTDVIKNTLEKSKRINEGLLKENAYLRQQNKQIREDLKTTERRLIGLESDYSSISSRGEREANNLRVLLEKLKDDRSADEKEIDRLRQKCESQSDSLKQYEQKENQWKIKQRHYQQKIEKQSNKFKQATAKSENIIKNQEQIIYDNQTSFETINNENRTLRRRINELELSAIRDRETYEKIKKSLKLSEEKNVANQTQLKQKADEQRSLQERIGALENRIGEKEQEIGKLREKHIEDASKSKKQDQIVELLNQELAKTQKLNEELTNTIKAKEVAEEKLRQDLKNEKEEVVKEKIKTTKAENDFEKFKENINDIIRIEFTRILNTPTTTQKNTERLRESQVSNAKSERSQRSRLALDAGALSSSLMQKLHETKNSLWKMVQLNKFLKQENNKLLTTSQNETNKYQFAQLELHRDIQLLEDEMNNIMSDKEMECQNYDQLVLDLNFRLKEKEAEAEDLRSEIAEYEAIVNGLKTDFEVNNDLNEKKVAAMKQSTNQLNERIEYLNLNVACLEDKNHELEQKTIEQESEIISYKEMLIKNEKWSLDLKESEEKLLESVQSFKKELKSRQEQYLELEMQHNSEKESKEKYTEMLEQEEKKCQRLNQFVNGLISQKQNAIKNELEKTEENNQLENQLFELTHQRDLLQEENATYKKKLEEFKDENKTLLKNIKALEKQLSEEKAKSARSIQKIKQRESDLQIKKEYIKDLEQKYRELRDKNYKEIRELSNQLEDKNLIAFNASKELNDKIIKVETQSKKRFEEALELQAEVETLTQQLYSEKDKSEDLAIEIARVKEEKIAIEQELASRQFALQERDDELNKLEELVGELRLQIHSLQAQSDSQEKEFDHHVRQLETDFNYKLQQTAKENSHNQEILLDENKQLKSKSSAIEEALAKSILEHQNQSAEYVQKIASYEERLKKIETERLNTVNAKNNEIKKISEESKLHHERFREKEAELRKLSLQLEQKKILEAELQAKISQLSEQAKNKEKVLEKEIEGLKLKDKLAHENKQKVLAGLHENQVQIRKLISQAVKKLMESCCKADTQKVYAAMKGLQSSVAQTMMAKITKE